jgi:autotransporter-associated beta strand protein
VVKNGTGTVTITTSNTYAGGTTVNAGTLNINNASAIGTGVLTMTGGTIDATAGNTVLTTNNAQNWNGDFTFKGTNSLNVGTGDVTLGASPTVTVTAGTLGVGSIPVATTGYGLTKAGTGTLSLTSTAVSNIDGTLNIQAGTIEMGGDMYVTGLTGSGTLQAYSTVGKWFFVNNSSDYTFSGVIQDASGYLGLNKNGSGKLTLTGANNYTLATTVQEGTLVFSGTNNSTQYEGIGITAAADGVLILTSGSSISVTSGTAVWSSSMSIGNNATGAGDLRVVSGSSLTTSQQLAVGALGYGAFSQSAGLTTIGGFIAVGNGGVGGILNLSGGTINCPNAPVTTGGNWNSSNFGVINLSGNAVMNLNGAAGNGFWVGEFGTGILNMSGNAALNINSGGTLTSGGGLVINNMQHGTGYTAYGTVNLCGGTITTPFVTNGDAGTGTSTFNFNGGTLKANASTTTFMSGLTNAYVYNGGAIIDDGGKNITIGQALLAPTTGTGNGVSATGLTFSGGGCIDTPLVTISGDGTGATAVANITYNSVTGLYDLTGITITNPGVNYTTAPTFSLVGGGIDNTASIGGAATLVTNVSGGLTKLGAGTTTLSGVNTYTGTTTVSNGILQAAITGSLPNYGLAGKVKVSTGATIAVNAGGLSSDWVASEVNTLDSSAAYSGGSYIGFDTTNATGSFTYSYAVANPLSGTKGLKKLGTNTLVLDATNTYSGATIVNNGTLELSSLGQINTASAISTTATTATFQVDGGTHTVGNISGTGTTSVLSGSLTATSVDQGTVTIGAGATLTIAAIPGGPGSGGSSLAPVPEPATWAMLMMAAMGLGIYWRRRR